MKSSQADSSGQQELAPSDWVVRFGVRIPPVGRVLDVACGVGRHARWFAERGYRVDAVDRERSPEPFPQIAFKRMDIETGEWPYAGQRFDAVIVTNYLYRPLMKTLVDSVAPHGWLIYETFAAGNGQFGKPSRPEFLLRPGELLDAVQGRLRVVAYEDGYVDAPRPAMVQRIAAQFEPD
jgi:SAM-dependent methyltransferase